MHLNTTSRLLVFAILLNAAACQNDNGAEYIVGTVERERIELTAESNDFITAIHVREGDQVTAGEIILEQDPSLFRARVDQLKAARDRATHSLAEQVRGPRIEDIDAARARLQGTESNLKIQERKYERVIQLVKEKLASPSLQDQTLELREAALAARDQSQAQLTALLEGTTIEELDQARATLNEADASVTVQTILLDRLQIKVPRNGFVDVLPYEIGERPLASSTVAVILAEGLPYARVYIPEPIRSQVIPGVAAQISVDGIDKVFTGKVRYVSSESAFTPYFALTPKDRSRLSFAAEVDFTEVDAEQIPSGVPVVVSFPSLDNQSR